MRDSIRGGQLPESAEDFARLPAPLRFPACIDCKQGFSPINTTTPAGWRETQISGVCEACFDNLFAPEPGESHEHRRNPHGC